MDGPRYDTKLAPEKRKPCTGCGGFRWSAKGECLNEPCISDETRELIFTPSKSKKKGTK